MSLNILLLLILKR